MKFKSGNKVPEECWLAARVGGAPRAQAGRQAGACRLAGRRRRICRCVTTPAPASRPISQPPIAQRVSDRSTQPPASSSGQGRPRPVLYGLKEWAKRRPTGTMPHCTGGRAESRSKWESNRHVGNRVERSSHQWGVTSWLSQKRRVGAPALLPLHRLRLSRHCSLSATPHGCVAACLHC